MAKQQRRKGRRGPLAPLAFLGNFGGVLFPIAAIALLSVPGILIYQTVHWLDTGSWPPISVAQGLEWAKLPAPQWSGHELVSKQFLTLPLSLVLFAVIAGPMALYAEFSRWLARQCGAGPGDDDAVLEPNPQPVPMREL